jgi:hypothetical protein
MPNSTSNLFVDEQQTVSAAKTKDDDVVVAAQAAVAPAQQEQDALVVTVVATCKTLDEACARKHATALAWQKEKIIAHHL